MASESESEDTDPTTPRSASLGNGSPPNVAAQQISLANKLLKLTILGWFIGLAYFNWFARGGYSVLPWWAHAGLIVGGLVASYIIGLWVIRLAALLWRLLWKPASLQAFGLVPIIVSPVIAFFAAKYALLLTASFLTQISN